MSAECLLRTLSTNHIIFRYFNVYGLRQHTDHYYTSVIIKFIKQIMKGESPTIEGSGEQSMDFVNVKDVVEANILAMESDVTDETINIGTGVSTSIKKLAETIIRIAEKDIEPIFTPREVFVTRRQADIRKAKRLLGFEPKIDIESGLKELVEDIINNPERY